MSLTADDQKFIISAISDGITQVVLPLFDEVYERLNDLDSRVGRMEVVVSGMRSDIYQLNQRMGRVETRLDNIEVRLETVENDVRDIYELLPAAS